MIATEIAGQRRLVDGCGRRIDHLRVSVTPHCDLRCVYCRPAGEQVNTCSANQLDDHQRLAFIRFMHERFGIVQVRVTGGEPLVHPGIVEFIAAIRDALPDLDVAMTTNGRRLKTFAQALRAAGLERLNISLDSLEAETYLRITGGDLQAALVGIEAAQDAGFPAPRVNAVVLRGLNNTELPQLADWALAKGIELRFLEAMPIGGVAVANRRALVTAAEIRATLRRHFTVASVGDCFAGTAQRYQVSDGERSGHIGIIAPITEPFCTGCRRVRLTADGRFFPCLLDSSYVDLRAAWPTGDRIHESTAAWIRSVVAAKKPEGPQRQAAAMMSLGG